MDRRLKYSFKHLSKQVFKPSLGAWALSTARTNHSKKTDRVPLDAVFVLEVAELSRRPYNFACTPSTISDSE